MSDQKLKDEMITQMIEDLNLFESLILVYPPKRYWLYELCDHLIRAGWRKAE